MNLNILAFDFGSKTGWSSLIDGKVESGVQEFALGRGESPGMRFLRFGVWIEAMMGLVHPQVCVYEQAHHRGGFATELLVGMVTRLQERCAIHGIDYMPVHSATLKKFATGSGRADKRQMINAAEKMFGYFATLDDNEADALLLLEYAKQNLGG